MISEFCEFGNFITSILSEIKKFVEYLGLLRSRVTKNLIFFIENDLNCFRVVLHMRYNGGNKILYIGKSFLFFE